MFAVSAPAHSAGSPDAARQNEPAFIDPNGLEVDGAGAVESSVEPDVADLTLLIISVTVALAALAMGVIDQHRSRLVNGEPSGRAKHPTA
jgi:hypothetical protein